MFEWGFKKQERKKRAKIKIILLICLPEEFNSKYNLIEFMIIIIMEVMMRITNGKLMGRGKTRLFKKKKQELY